MDTRTDNSYTLVTYSTGSEMVTEVLDDWLEFLREPPSEVIFAVSATGSLPPVYSELVGCGRIDRLLDVPLAGRSVNETDPDAIRLVIQAAKTEWVLLVKLDTLPYRRGYDDWLTQDFAAIKQHGLFGLTGGFKMNDIRSLSPGYSVTQKYSNNFALFRREEWLQVVNAGIGTAWEGALATEPIFQGDNRRFAVEAAIEKYLQDTGRAMLVRHESNDWSVFHINVWGDQLRRVREAYHQRDQVEPFLNDGRRPPAGLVHPWQWYYMYPKPSILKRFRIWIGRLRKQAFDVIGCGKI